MLAVSFLALLTLSTATFAQVNPITVSLTNEATVTLSMQGKTWPLQLNQQFTEHTPTPFQITGNVGNNPRDRVALTVHQWPTDLVGSFMVDGQWYQVESRHSAVRFIGDLATDSALVAMQPNVNLMGGLGFGDMDVVLSHPADLTSPNRNTPNSNTLSRNNAVRTIRALRVGIIVDSRFNDRHSGRGIARALTIMNGVDAILQNELGLAIEVDQIVDYTDPATDPFRLLASDIGTEIMPALQEERLGNTELTDNLALVHLFSGHVNQAQATVVGLGWLNSVCNTNGFDVSLSTPFLFDTLLATHEIIHNLGAPHDNDLQCATYPDISDEYLMWSNITASSTNELSACSLDTTRDALSASCAVNALDMGIEISLRSQNDSQNHELALVVINTDATRTAPDATTQTDLPANTQILALPANCRLSGSTLICEHDAIAPGQFSQQRLLINTGNTTDTRVRSEVMLNTNVDRNRTNNVAVLTIPDASFSDNNLVTVSTNTTMIDQTANTANSPANSPANNIETGLTADTSLAVAPQNALIEPSALEPSPSSSLSLFGATSLSTLWTMLLLVLYRLVASINRVKRKRL